MDFVHIGIFVDHRNFHIAFEVVVEDIPSVLVFQEIQTLSDILADTQLVDILVDIHIAFVVEEID